MYIFNNFQRLKYKPQNQTPMNYEMPVPEKDVTVTFMKNPEPLDDKLYCLCQKKWDGQIMIECELCDNWYHPKCIGIFEHDDVKLNLMYIICSICRISNNKSLGFGNSNEKPVNKQIANTTSMDMLLSQTNLNLPSSPVKNQIEQEENKVVNLSHSKEGNIFKISLNKNKVKEIFQNGVNQMSSTVSPNLDLKIIEPFSDINQPKQASTEDLAQVQMQRINRILNRYYPSESDRIGFKKLRKLMISQSNDILAKRKFGSNCFKGKQCEVQKEESEISKKIKEI